MILEAEKPHDISSPNLSALKDYGVIYPVSYGLRLGKQKWGEHDITPKVKDPRIRCPNASGFRR